MTDVEVCEWTKRDGTSTQNWSYGTTEFYLSSNGNAVWFCERWDRDDDLMETDSEECRWVEWRRHYYPNEEDTEVKGRRPYMEKGSRQQGLTWTEKDGKIPQGTFGAYGMWLSPDGNVMWLLEVLDEPSKLVAPGNVVRQEPEPSECDTNYRKGLWVEWRRHRSF